MEKIRQMVINPLLYHHLSYEIVNHWAYTPVSETAIIYVCLGKQGFQLWFIFWELAKHAANDSGAFRLPGGLTGSKCRMTNRFIWIDWRSRYKQRTHHHSQNIAFFSTYSAHPLQWSGWFAINVEIRDRLVDRLKPFVGLRGIKSVPQESWQMTDVM